MKKNFPERYRQRTGLFVSTTNEPFGVFTIPHHKIADYFYQCIVSSGMGWEHVSITLQSPSRKVERCPTWEEMCYIKDQFWNDTEAVVQFHPPADAHVNNHPFCLHLWRPTDMVMPLPNSLMVGYKSLGKLKP